MNNIKEVFKLRKVGLDLDTFSTCLREEAERSDRINLNKVILLGEIVDNYHFSLDTTNCINILNFFKLLAPQVLEKKKLTVTVNKLDSNLKDVIVDLSKGLGGLRIDTLFINAKENVGEYSEVIKDLIESMYVSEVGISNPTSSKDFDNFTEGLKLVTSIEKVKLSLSVLEYNYELMEWIKESGHKIHSFNPFCGHYTSNLALDTFSPTFLLNFSAYHSDTVYLSSRDLELCIKSVSYLNNIKFTETNGSLYRLSASVNKVQKSLSSSNFINTTLELTSSQSQGSYSIPFKYKNSQYFSASPKDINLKVGGVDVFSFPQAMPIEDKGFREIYDNIVESLKFKSQYNSLDVSKFHSQLNLWNSIGDLISKANEIDKDKKYGGTTYKCDLFQFTETLTVIVITKREISRNWYYFGKKEKVSTQVLFSVVTNNGIKVIPE